MIWMTQQDYYYLPYAEDVITIYDGDIFLHHDYDKMSEGIVLIAHVNSHGHVTFTEEKVGFM